MKESDSHLEVKPSRIIQTSIKVAVCLQNSLFQVLISLVSRCLLILNKMFRLLAKLTQWLFACVFSHLSPRNLLLSVATALTIKDLYRHNEILTAELARKQEQCKMDYVKNNCEPSLRLEAAAEFCEQQQKCQDQNIGMIKIVLSYVSSLLNFLVDNMTLGAWLVLAGVLLFLCFYSITQKKWAQPAKKEIFRQINSGSWQTVSAGGMGGTLRPSDPSDLNLSM